MADNHEDLLVRYLSDAYSIEQQALAQLRTAPEIAGPPAIAEAHREHLVQTERQAEMVRERLEAHGGSPSRLKDAVMALGGKGFLLFARSQPDTPGKLMSHAHSYEAFEEASYEMLLRMAERAGDQETAGVARTIRDQEAAMVKRLAGLFDEAADASLEKVGADDGPNDMTGTLGTYLADAHALEEQAKGLLKRGEDIAGAPELERIYREHLEETKEHARLVEERLDALGGDPSSLKDAALRAAALNWGMFFQAQPDTPGKLAVFAYAFEHLEIAGYEQLRRVAERAGDERTAGYAERIVAQERAQAGRVASAFDRAFEASMDARGVSVR